MRCSACGSRKIHSAPELYPGGIEAMRTRWAGKQPSAKPRASAEVGARSCATLGNVKRHARAARPRSRCGNLSLRSTPPRRACRSRDGRKGAGPNPPVSPSPRQTPVRLEVKGARGGIGRPSNTGASRGVRALVGRLPLPETAGSTLTGTRAVLHTLGARPPCGNFAAAAGRLSYSRVGAAHAVLGVRLAQDPCGSRALPRASRRCAHVGAASRSPRSTKKERP
jgi:hypothetical protein